MMFYSSYPDVFEVDVNPKAAQVLASGDTVTYIISFYTSNASLREYPFEFEITTQELARSGNVTLDVRETPESLRGLIEERLINYRILISDIEVEIDSAARKNLNVFYPTSFIASAKEGINATQAFYDQGRYEDALNELDKVEKDIKDAVFTLGNATLRLYAVQRFDLLLLLLLILIALAIYYIWRRRRKNRRPRLLQRAKEE
jgi:hypothetical protein